MPNSSLLSAVVVSLSVVFGSVSIAQTSPEQEPSGPTAYRGSFEARLDADGSLSIVPRVFVPRLEQREGVRKICKTVMVPQEKTYEVKVDGKTETRSRTVNVAREVCEEQAYTYTVTLGVPEEREEISNPKIFRYAGVLFTSLPVSPTGPEAASIRSSDNVLFVRSSSDMARAVQLVEESNRRQIELTGIAPASPNYVVVLEEKYDVEEVESLRKWMMSNPSDQSALTIENVGSKAIGRSGSIVADKDSSDRLLLDTTYEVTVCVPETRVRTVNVNSEGKVVQMEQTYTTMVPHKETKQGRLDSPVIFAADQNSLVLGRQVMDMSVFSEPHTALFVNSSQEAHKVHSMLKDAARLMIEAGITPPARPDFIVVEAETFDYVAAANAPQAASAALMQPAAVPAPLGSAAPPAVAPAPVPAWPLPTEKGAWISSLPFTQKSLNGKAVVLWFFDEECQECKAKWRAVNTMPAFHKGKPVVFVAVNSGNSAEVVTEYVRQYRVNLAVIADSDRQLGQWANVGEIKEGNTSRAVIMTPDGQFHPIDTDDLKAAAAAAIELVKPSP